MDAKRQAFIDKDHKKHRDLNLPFEIGKPKKSFTKDTYYECSNCGNGTFITRHTVMYVCKYCGKLEKVNNGK